MNDLQKLFTALVIIAVAGCVFVTPRISYADYEDSITETFKVGRGGTLTVESDLGSIEITTGRTDEVAVEIIREVDTSNRNRAEEILDELDIDFSQSGNNVTITAEYDNWRRGGGFFDRLFNFGRNPLKLKYSIVVPEEYNVDLKTSGGSISVDDLEGEARCKTSGGSLKFGEIIGPVWGNTSGGSITLESCVGDADINTSGGSIRIGDVDGNIEAKTSGGSITIDHAQGAVNAGTSGGGITVEEVMGEIEAHTSGGSITARISSQPRGDCKLSTSGGSVNVYLAENINMNVDAKTSGGKVRTDFPVTVTGELKKNELRAEINGGGPELYLRTSGGSINLRD